MSVELSDRQRAAVTASEPKFTVLAAAGSGKTRVLVERFIHLVKEHGLDPRQILTITYTRKAEQEMRQRIIERFRAEGELDLVQSVESGAIHTIHGFCDWLLRACSVEAGVSPDFEILGDFEAKWLLERALREEFEAGFASMDLALEYIRRHAGTTDFTTRLESVHAHVRSVLDALRPSGSRRQELAAIYASPESYEEHVDGLVLRTLSPELQAQLVGQRGSLSARIQALPAEIRPKKASWAKDFKQEIFQNHARQACGLVQIALRVWDRMESLMTQEQAFDFTTLEARAVHLVEDMEAIQHRLRETFAAVLVDEAQDVNPVQFRLLRAMNLPNEMLVGDPMQSIYGFRGAEPRLFADHSREVANYPLTTNYRSGSGILQFIDDVMMKGGAPDYRPSAPEDSVDPFGGRSSTSYLGVEAWPLREKNVEQVVLWLQDLLAEGVPPGDIAVLVSARKEAQPIVARLKQHGITARMVSGAEQFYTRMVVRDLANTLVALCEPKAKFEFLAMLRSPLVGLSLDMIVQLATSDDPQREVFEMDVCLPDDGAKLSEFRRWWSKVRSVADRKAAWEVMGDLIHEARYWESLARQPNAAQDLANARKLLTLATGHPEMGPIDFARKIRGIHRLQHREDEPVALDQSGDEIQFMTIHGAKGLEFPVVVLPGTLRKSGYLPNLLIDARSGLVVPGVGDSMARKWAEEQFQKRRDDEDWRVLYVAMTRAKDRLCVVMHPNAAHGTPAHKLASAVGFKGEELNGLRTRKGRLTVT